ncbi:hypothetical protein SDC9_12389 [bioreactor metagenome]|uniref:Abortive phage infection protein C-terminal domain-containing protein n=1 Tax=bioreactor metagenome TaxID=1076179 RepID=A0A644TK90_9ZZZZ
MEKLKADNKYQILIKILDEIKNEAPDKYKKYHSVKEEDIPKIRAKCYIHLFLKVTFGILDFEDREYCITDDTYDGGIDAYYIDQEDKVIYYIQSKFRNTKDNFNEKDILYDELLCMDIARIIREGEVEDLKGNRYNGKILQMKKNISDISNLPLYSTKVILLANANNKESEQIKKAIGGYEFELFDYDKAYKKLVFPIITSTFYNKESIIIKIKVNGTNNNRAKSYIKTSYKECNITMLLVPVKEIGRIMSMYKNSILKYNPRSFLSLQNNIVNKNIEKAIKEIDSNDFALFNNGVTMIADNAKYSDETAEKGVDQLLLTNPQIINGGQTAYTLSQIYEECDLNNNFKVMDNKSVVLKVITLLINKEEKLGLELIEKISKATNFQTPVEIQDRISNDEKQILLQKFIFDSYGYFYERKKGEYAEGISKKYINRSLIIEKPEFMRIFLAATGTPNKSRQDNLSKLFSESNLERIEISKIQVYFFAYKIYEYIKELRAVSYYEDKYGKGLRYGIYAIVYAVILKEKDYKLEEVQNKVNDVLLRWKEFESSIISKSYNKKYFEKFNNENNEVVLQVNYPGYYRGTTINKDIFEFFRKFDS